MAQDHGVLGGVADASIVNASIAAASIAYTSVAGAVRAGASIVNESIAGASIAGAVCAGRRLVGDFPSQCLAQFLDALVARDDGVAQCQLLPFELRFQLRLVGFQLAQPPDVRAVGGADEVRQHVHVAERLAHQGRRGGRMRQRRPIGAWDIAAPHGIPPQGADAVGGVGLGELIDGKVVALVQRLVQQFARSIVAAGQGDGGAVQFVVGAVPRRQLQLLHNLPQIAGGQAGADDRAMQVGVEFPELGAARRPRRRRGFVACQQHRRQRIDRDGSRRQQRLRAASHRDGRRRGAHACPLRAAVSESIPR